MNEMDLLTRLRTEVPDGVSPRAEDLFLTALQKELSSERPVLPRPRNPLARITCGWRLAVIGPAAARRGPDSAGGKPPPVGTAASGSAAPEPSSAMAEGGALA